MKQKLRDRRASYSLGYDNPKRVPVDRQKLGHFVNGYIDAALEDVHDPFASLSWDDMSVEDISGVDSLSEPTLLQMIRDCLHFTWRTRAILTDLYERGELSQSLAGRAFWRDRNRVPEHGFGQYGFSQQWVILETQAIGFGTCTLWVDDHDEVAILPNIKL